MHSTATQYPVAPGPYRSKASCRHSRSACRNAACCGAPSTILFPSGPVQLVTRGPVTQPLTPVTKTVKKAKLWTIFNIDAPEDSCDFKILLHLRKALSCGEPSAEFNQSSLVLAASMLQGARSLYFSETRRESPPCQVPVEFLWNPLCSCIQQSAPCRAFGIAPVCSGRARAQRKGWRCTAFLHQRDRTNSRRLTGGLVWAVIRRPAALPKVLAGMPLMLVGVAFRV